MNIHVMRIFTKMLNMTDKQLSIGICHVSAALIAKHNFKANVDDQINVCDVRHKMLDCFQTWKGYSGSITYPISTLVDVSNWVQFHDCKDYYDSIFIERWFVPAKNKAIIRRYCQARRSLICHIIDQIAQELENERS